MGKVRLFKDDLMNDVTFTAQFSETEWQLAAQHDEAACVLRRLWRVYIEDGEQFLAGEIKRIAKEMNVKLEE